MQLSKFEYSIYQNWTKEFYHVCKQVGTRVAYQATKLIVNCPSGWSLYLSLPLCVDHLSQHHSNRETGTAIYHQSKNPTTSELTLLTFTFEDRSCILLVVVFQQIFSAKYHLYLHLVNFKSRVLFVVFVFSQKSESENYLYLYSAKYLNPNIICIAIWPKTWIQILFRILFDPSSASNPMANPQKNCLLMLLLEFWITQSRLDSDRQMSGKFFHLAKNRVKVFERRNCLQTWIYTVVRAQKSIKEILRLLAYSIPDIIVPLTSDKMFRSQKNLKIGFAVE